MKGLQKNILLPLMWIGGSFFAARCMLFDMVCPAGSSYLALMMSQNRLWGAIPAAIAGIITRRGEIDAAGYICAYLGIGAISGVIRYFDLSVTYTGRSLAAGLCTITGGLVNAVLQGSDPRLIIIVLLQGILSFLLTTLFCEGTEALMTGGGYEIYGASLMAGCIYGGMDGISVMGIPVVLPAAALMMPAFIGKKVLTGSDANFIRQRAGARLDGFARSMDRLAASLKAVTDSIDEEDTEQLKKNIKKSRSLLSEELLGVSALMRSLSKELNEELALDTHLGRAVKEKLKENGIACRDVLVYTHVDNRYEVSVVRRYNGSCSRCARRIIPIVSKELGVKMTKGSDICSSEGGYCTLRLCCELPYRISAYAASKKRDGSSVSGDSHTFMELKYGKYMLALSDGMGSGGKAREESAASVELFEDFIEAGFERDMAIEQINSLLLMRAGGEDIFATLDICNVDLYTGTAEFVKIGAMPGFVSGREGVRLIGSGGLPVGIIENTESESMELKLESGDTIVMVTDGVTEAAPCAIGKENWLARLIDKNSALSPEKLCEKILAEAEAASGGVIKDDMTVLAARIWKV